jgi:hypothetical protein
MMFSAFASACAVNCPRAGSVMNSAGVWTGISVEYRPAAVGPLSQAVRLLAAAGDQ